MNFLSRVKALKTYPSLPEVITALCEGYSFSSFLNDLRAGITVGVISLPLAMVFAIHSGLTPERGLYTSIVAGFLISLLGGSRVQIGGPAGAFVILVYAVVQKHGYEWLALATLLAGGLLILFGIFRLGSLIHHVPKPVVTGFTTGLALVLMTSQIKDFLGLSIDNLAPDLFEKIGQYIAHIHTLNPLCLIVSMVSLSIILYLQKRSKKIPGAIIAIIITGGLTAFFELPIETIDTKFGKIASELPPPTLPFFSLEFAIRVLPDAVSIALLGALESLLSATIADSMTGFRHKPNCELIGQGLANIGSSLFGGIPATGAIARTTANIQIGGRTPVSGIIHAATVFVLIALFAPLAEKMPLGALAAILMVVAWNMSDIGHFLAVLKGTRKERVLLICSFLATACLGLGLAVQLGLLAAIIAFLYKKMIKPIA
ncbi:MAG: sodium-independent anion transporter [Verrucomicrobia bacterium]|nr:sodium-independent anion transporter [Verrucomicrobiota bacterium]